MYSMPQVSLHMFHDLTYTVLVYSFFPTVKIALFLLCNCPCNEIKETAYNMKAQFPTQNANLTAVPPAHLVLPPGLKQQSW